MVCESVENTLPLDSDRETPESRLDWFACCVGLRFLPFPVGVPRKDTTVPPVEECRYP